MYLASTASSDDISIPNRAFDNHNGIVQTPFYLRDELLCASS